MPNLQPAKSTFELSGFNVNVHNPDTFKVVMVSHEMPPFKLLKILFDVLSPA